MLIQYIVKIYHFTVGIICMCVCQSSPEADPYFNHLFSCALILRFFFSVWVILSFFSIYSTRDHSAVKNPLRSAEKK